MRNHLALALAPPGRFAGAADSPHLVATEEFRRRVEREVDRHDRHLRPFGLLRIGPLAEAGDRAALEESLETETRRTDAVCRLPDGSWAVLAVETGERGLRALAERLAATAREISAGPVEPRYVAGASVAGDRRVGPDELWAAVSAAFTEAKAHGSPFTLRT